nr:TIGR03619 family F420-dependent LLM class oxidoreductase [Gordonia sp. LAM0048]
MGGAEAHRDSIGAVAVAADEHGLDSVWVSDHIALPASAGAAGLPPATLFYEALISLCHVGALTTRVQLGTGVLVGPLREPLLLTKQAATVDALTGGRLVLGLGAGWLADEFTAVAMPFAGRGKAVSGSVSTMRTAWRTGRVHVDGLDEPVGMHPLPVDGTVPVMLGGTSPAALRRAATIADGWYGANQTAAQVAEVRKTLCGLADSRQPIRIGVKPPLVTPATAAATVAEYGQAGCDFVVLETRFDDPRPAAMADLVGELAAGLELTGARKITPLT